MEPKPSRPAAAVKVRTAESRSRSLFADVSVCAAAEVPVLPADGKEYIPLGEFEMTPGIVRLALMVYRPHSPLLLFLFGPLLTHKPAADDAPGRHAVLVHRTGSDANAGPAHPAAGSVSPSSRPVACPNSDGRGNIITSIRFHERIRVFTTKQLMGSSVLQKRPLEEYHSEDMAKKQRGDGEETELFRSE